MKASAPVEMFLREVTESDLPIFFEQQLDPDATRMAAFPARDREAFTAHWARILADASVIIKTILWDGQVAGNIVSFEQDGRREVGYWLGKAYWGRGIASQALSVFLDDINVRPLYAHVAKHNLASLRVLEKNGFTVIGASAGISEVQDGKIEEYVMEKR
jgi:RimJ/RimL family protein N-acetyltransferase